MKLKKILLLSAMCLTTSVFTQSCSSDLTDDSAQSKEKMLTISVSAGIPESAETTESSIKRKAILTDGPASVWKWESGDKLLLITTNASGAKVVTTLKLKNTAVGKSRGEFEGTIPASGIKDGDSCRFFYVGKSTDGRSDRTISAEDLSAGKITIDLSSQTGKLADLKRNCVLSGLGKVEVSETSATVDGTIFMKNAFSVAHFAMSTNDGKTITKVGVRGLGVYTEASVDLTTGEATGVSEAGLELDPEANLFFPDGTTDFYVTFVPGKVAPSFDAYYADSYTSAIGALPETRTYKAEDSFVYYGNKKAEFSVSDNKKVAFTNGNMQYVMPVNTYTYNMKANKLKANSLVRWAVLTPLKVKGTLFTHAGYYRLAPEQWKTAMPKKTKNKASFSYATIALNGNTYISPEVYRYFDNPSWGMIDTPTLIRPFSSKLSGSGVDTQYDFGNKVKVGSEPTRVLTSDEWGYLLPTYNITASTQANARLWGSGRDAVMKWAKCYIKMSEANRETTNQEEVRGYLIFPDDMTLEEAKAMFPGQDPIFGSRGNMSKNATTYDMIRKSGAVFLPLSAFRNVNTATLSVWGQHGNYFTSSYTRGGIIHIKITATETKTNESSAPGQGCMSRLVQDIR